MTNGTRLRSTRDEALRGGGEQGDGLREGCAQVADEQHQTGQQALHEGGCVGSIALARAGGKLGELGGCSAHQRGDVVGQDLGGHVDDEGLLAQARDGFEVQPMFEPLESFLGAPALVPTQTPRCENSDRFEGRISIQDLCECWAHRRQRPHWRPLSLWRATRVLCPGSPQLQRELLQRRDATFFSLLAPRLKVDHQLLGRHVGARPQLAEFLAHRHQLGQTRAVFDG